MKFTHYDLGYRERGEIAEVVLSGNAANVRLLDGSNFSSYRNGRKHRYFGGRATQSPVRLAIPRSGHWHIAIDMQGLRGSVKSSLRIVPSPLPPIREAPLSSVPTLIRDAHRIRSEGESDPKDVFIAHAKEDASEVAEPLVEALIANGLDVWYDDLELKIGDSLRRLIDRGISRSRFAVVVLSPAFMQKGWTNYELDGIITQSNAGGQVVLPIWHDVTKQKVIDFSPSLADKVARSTSVHTVAEIADEIAQLIQSPATD